MTKRKNYVSEDCIVLDVIMKHSIKIFECYNKQNKQHKKQRQQVMYSQTKSFAFKEYKQ